jgi:dTDP-4-amino-4,6-dideoxygalactose transaminase
MGDAGAVATDDEALAQRVDMTRNHGRKDKYIHQFEAVNMRLDEIQAAVLRVKLSRLEGWTKARNDVAEAYAQALSGIGDLVLPHSDPSKRAVFHLFVVETARRDDLRAFLTSRQISTGIHYPVPLPLQPAFAHHGLGARDIPVTAAKADRILSLPMFPEMTSAQIEYVRDTIRDFFAGKA